MVISLRSRTDTTASRVRHPRLLSTDFCLAHPAQDACSAVVGNPWCLSAAPYAQTALCNASWHRATVRRFCGARMERTTLGELRRVQRWPLETAQQRGIVRLWYPADSIKSRAAPVHLYVYNKLKGTGHLDFVHHALYARLCAASLPLAPPLHLFRSHHHSPPPSPPTPHPLLPPSPPPLQGTRRSRPRPASSSSRGTPTTSGCGHRTARTSASAATPTAPCSICAPPSPGAAVRGARPDAALPQAAAHTRLPPIPACGTEPGVNATAPASLEEQTLYFCRAFGMRTCTVPPSSEGSRVALGRLKHLRKAFQGEPSYTKPRLLCSTMVVPPTAAPPPWQPPRPPP